MNKTAKELIKLGHEKPELRDHIRPVLDALTKSAASTVKLVEVTGSPKVSLKRDKRKRSYAHTFDVKFQIPEGLNFDKGQAQREIRKYAVDIADRYSEMPEYSEVTPHAAAYFLMNEPGVIEISGSLLYPSKADIPSQVDPRFVQDLTAAVDRYFSSSKMQGPSADSKQAMNMFQRWADALVRDLNSIPGMKAKWEPGKNVQVPLRFSAVFSGGARPFGLLINLGGGYKMVDPFKLVYNPPMQMNDALALKDLGVREVIEKHNQGLQRFQTDLQRNFGKSIKQLLDPFFR